MRIMLPEASIPTSTVWEFAFFRATWNCLLNASHCSKMVNPQYYPISTGFSVQSTILQALIIASPATFFFVEIHISNHHEEGIRILRFLLPIEGYILFQPGNSRLMTLLPIIGFHGWKKYQGWPYKDWHTFRHTAISDMIIRGVPIFIVSKATGHAQQSTSLNIYSHVIKSIKSAAIEAHEKKIAQLKNKSVQ